MKPTLPAALAALVLLCACSSDGAFKVKDQPEDMNVSPRSMEAYDPAVRDLDKDNQ